MKKVMSLIVALCLALSIAVPFMTSAEMNGGATVGYDTEMYLTCPTPGVDHQGKSPAYYFYDVEINGENLQGKATDIWGRNEGHENYEGGKWQDYWYLSAGQSNTYKLSVDKDATSLVLDDTLADSCKKFTISLSANGTNWTEVVNITDSIGSYSSVDAISAEFSKQMTETNLTANQAVLAECAVEGDKKVVYVKIDVKDGGQTRIKWTRVATSTAAVEGGAGGDDDVATSGTENFGADTNNRDGNSPNPDAATYFNKYLVADQSNIAGLYHLVKLQNGNSYTFKYDLNDATTKFVPYFRPEKPGKVTIKASKDGENYLTIVDAEAVANGRYGDATILDLDAVADSGYTGTVNMWSTFNEANMNAVLADNPTKTVYIKFEFAGAVEGGGNNIEVRGFGLSSAWDTTVAPPTGGGEGGAGGDDDEATTGAEYIVSETQNRTGYGTPDAEAANYFEKYLVADKSSYYGLNWLIKMNGDRSKTVFRYDLHDGTTEFTPYAWVSGNKDAKLAVKGSKDGENWVELVTAFGAEHGKKYGSSDMDFTAAGAQYSGDMTAWPNFNTDNMKALLTGNNAKVIYLSFEYADTTSELQMQGFGVSTKWDESTIDTTIDPSLPTTSNEITLTEEIRSATDNRKGYETNVPERADYFNTYLVEDQSVYSELFWMVKLTAGGKIVMKYDLADATTEFMPWLRVQGNKTAKLQVRGSKDGENWVDLVTPFAAKPGDWYGEKVDFPNYSTDNMNAILTDNAEKIVWLSFEYAGDDVDAESQLQGFGITGKYDTKALSAEVTAMDKVNYALNDTKLSLAGGKLAVTYESGDVLEYTITSDMARGFKPGVAGAQNIYVEKHGVVASYEIVVDAQEVKSIAINGTPKAKYEVGDKIDLTDMVITVTYADDSTAEVNVLAEMISDFNTSEVKDAVTVTVTYGGKSATYDIEVIEKSETLTADSVRIDATPYVTPDGMLEMLDPEGQEADHQRLLEQRKTNNCEDDLNLGEMITDSLMTMTTPTGSNGVLLNVFGDGYFTFEVDLDDRAVDFTLTRGWGVYNNMKVLASKDGGENWYIIGRALQEVSGMNTVWTSDDLSQETIDKNIEWILTGNPEKKFLLKFTCDGESIGDGTIEGKIQINNLIYTYDYNVGPDTSKDLPTEVPADYEAPEAYYYGQLPSEKAFVDDGGDEGEDDGNTDDGNNDGTTDDGNNDGTVDDGEDDITDTGVETVASLAVVLMLIAGAAVVILKKRSRV